MQDYITRVIELVNQMRGLGHTNSEVMVVGKVLRSLGAKYNYIMMAIEESKSVGPIFLSVFDCNKVSSPDSQPYFHANP